MVFLAARIDASPVASTGSNAAIRAEVKWLACRQECVPGRASLSLSLPVSEERPRADPRWAHLFAEARGRLAAADPEASGAPFEFILAVLFAFLGGLILNLMPCVLPVLSLKVMGFVREAHFSPHGALAHGLSFTAGVVASFWILLGVLLLLRAAGGLLGWGFQFQNPSVVAAMAVLMFVLG